MIQFFSRGPLSLITVIVFIPFTSCNTQLNGCTDPMANNYDPEAIINDGSCSYDPISLYPEKSVELDSSLKETSGLTLWDGLIWTHNDSDDNRLYGLDTNSGEIQRTEVLVGAVNQDWEEISSDADYIYVGDIGNNSGSRTNLHILRVKKSSLGTGNPVFETIWFSYEDQFDFKPAGGQQTDFDCEAFLVTSDSIFLFTKQWLSLGTAVYAIPNKPGTFVAIRTGSYDVGGLITGAAFMEEQRLLVLSGYSSLLVPFFHICYDFQGNDFFGGDNRRVNISIPFCQVEGIATDNGLDYYITNETTSVVNSPASLQLFNLYEVLWNYLNSQEEGMAP